MFASGTLGYWDLELLMAVQLMVRVEQPLLMAALEVHARLVTSQQ